MPDTEKDGKQENNENIENVDSFLEEEAKRINEEILKEQEGNLADDPAPVDDPSSEDDPASGDDPAPEDDPASADDLGTKLAQDIEPQKTEITEEIRTKFDIPEKFKYVEDFSKWGKEAEKAKSRAEVELDKLRQDYSKNAEKIAYLEGQLSKIDKKEDVSEESERLAEAFREDFEKDPVATLNKVLSKYEEKKLEQEKEKQAKIEQQRVYEQIKQEEQSLLNHYGEDRYTKEIEPELRRISDEKPYLRSLKDAHAIYLVNKQEKEKALKLEQEQKRQIKKKTFSETGTDIKNDAEKEGNKIENATTIEELDRAAGLI